MTPADVLAGLLRSDPTSPRITCYDDHAGERIELSGKVLVNWVSKAANLLQEELDAGPGTTIGLHLPADHWRTYYWALAAWSVGATVVTTGAPCDIAIGTEGTGTEGTDTADQQIIVTLAALARRATVELPPGAIDEARELATYGDVFVPYLAAQADDDALDSTTYADLVTVGRGALGTRMVVRGDLPAALTDALAVWAEDGSVLLLRGVDPDDVARRLSVEGAILPS